MVQALRRTSRRVAAVIGTALVPHLSCVFLHAPLLLFPFALITCNAKKCCRCAFIFFISFGYTPFTPFPSDTGTCYMNACTGIDKEAG